MRFLTAQRRQARLRPKYREQKLALATLMASDFDRWVDRSPSFRGSSGIYRGVRGRRYLVEFGTSDLRQSDKSCVPQQLRSLPDVNVTIYDRIYT